MQGTCTGHEDFGVEAVIQLRDGKVSQCAAIYHNKITISVQEQLVREKPGF